MSPIFLYIFFCEICLIRLEFSKKLECLIKSHPRTQSVSKSTAIRGQLRSKQSHQCVISDGSLEELRGHPRKAHPHPNSFNLTQFLGKFLKIICWCPHLREILDPPLVSLDSTGSSSLLSAVHIVRWCSVRISTGVSKEKQNSKLGFSHVIRK